ncbi:MAG: hypothetical protein GY721_05450 [Deltaproteobacteria bacterium]|nr:hypothetical protein [Deltaproteobacteria bacterium]
MVKPFTFFECVGVEKSTGRWASNIIEFLEILRQASPECVFHHMHQYFLKVTPQHSYYTNDFAVWVAEWLEEKSLAERLANLNPYAYNNVEDLRGETLHIIEEYLRDNPPPRPVLPGGEFYFCEGVTIVVPAGLEATDIEEFVECLDQVDRSSIYFHCFEARLRLGREKDDFSEWLATSMGREDIAERIRGLDAYMYDLDTLREIIKDIISEGVE